MNTRTNAFKLHVMALALFVSMLACGLPAATSPAVFYVRSGGNDSNDCRSVANPCLTVRAAVMKAIVGSTVDIGAGTFHEPIDIMLEKNLVLRGAGQERTVLSAGGHGWIFNIVSAQVRLQDLTVSGAGNPSAVGAIEIYNVSNVVLERVTVRDNVGNGVLLFNGVLTVIDCTFQANRMGLGNLDGLMQISSSMFRLNTGATGSGSALYNSATTSVTNSTFTQNNLETIENIASDRSGRRDHAHGIMTITTSSIANNMGTVGLRNIGGRLTVSQTFIADNAGAGIVNDGGVLSLQDSVVSHNQGRGVDVEIYGSSPTSVAEILETAIINNTASGLYLGNGTARLTNVTVSGNSAGIRVVRGNLALAYSTVASNNQWGLQLDYADASADLLNSIVALNASTMDCVSGSPAQIRRDSASLACDIALTNARLRLGPLVADAGTQIHPLQAGSPAIDAAAGSCPEQDQRGYARPYDGNGDGRRVCDVGAYEFGAGLHQEAGTPGIIEILPGQTPEASITPTATPGASMLTLIQNANCRYGPGSVYPVLTSFLQGQSLQVDGRNENLPRWWRIALPNSNQHCWVSESAGTPDGDLNGLPVIPAPPTPTATLKPDKGATDFDKDGYPSDVDCDDKNAKVHPGAAETPKDSVDSNCDGKDDS